MNNIEYGNKLIRLGKLMKNDKTKLKDLVGAALECGLIYSFGLTPQADGSVELDLIKPDTPYPVTAAVQLAKMAVDMEDIASALETMGHVERAQVLRGIADTACKCSKGMQTDCA